MQSNNPSMLSCSEGLQKSILGHGSNLTQLIRCGINPWGNTVMAPLFTDPRKCCKPTAFLKWYLEGALERTPIQSHSLLYTQEMLASSTNDFWEISERQKWELDSGLLSPCLASSSLTLFSMYFPIAAGRITQWGSRSVICNTSSHQWLHMGKAFKSHS